MKLKDLTSEQQAQVKGLVDACVGCAGRKSYYKFAEKVGLLGAIDFLREIPESNDSTVTILEGYLNSL